MGVVIRAVSNSAPRVEHLWRALSPDHVMADRSEGMT